jgi:hypothetical protein
LGDQLREHVLTASKIHADDMPLCVAGRELVIDLQGVTDISADGEEALYCLMVQGAKFRGGGVFINQVLKQLAQRVRRNRQLHWQKGE